MRGFSALFKSSPHPTPPLISGNTIDGMIDLETLIIDRYKSLIIVVINYGHMLGRDYFCI